MIDLIQNKTEALNPSNRPTNDKPPSPLISRTRAAFNNFLNNLEETIFGTFNNLLIGTMYTVMFLGEVTQAIGLTIYNLIKQSVNFVRSLTK